jgi:hypothetical protein
MNRQGQARTVIFEEEAAPFFFPHWGSYIYLQNIAFFQK